MNFRVNISRIALLAVCTMQPLAAALIAGAQAATASTANGQASPSEPQVLTSDGKPFEEDWPGQVTAYVGFINEIAAEEADLGKSSESSRSDFVKLLGIRTDEDRAMRTVMVESSRRLSEANGALWANENDQDSTPAERETKFTTLKQLAGKIVPETIAKLKREFGPEDFGKLDAWVQRTSGYPHKAVIVVRPPSRLPKSGQAAAKADPAVKQ